MTNFLCTNCNKNMCPNCKSIALEYHELLDNTRISLKIATDKLVELEREISWLERSRDGYKSVAYAGVPNIIEAWVNKSIEDLVGEI